MRKGGAIGFQESGTVPIVTDTREMSLWEIGTFSKVSSGLLGLAGVRQVLP